METFGDLFSKLKINFVGDMIIGNASFAILNFTIQYVLAQTLLNMQSKLKVNSTNPRQAGKSSFDVIDNEEDK